MAWFFSSSIRKFSRFSTFISGASISSLVHPQRTFKPEVVSKTVKSATWYCHNKSSFVPGVFFCSQSSEIGQGPTAIDYSSLLSEEEFHKLADGTIQDLQEKIEEFGDDLEIDGFDVDYGSQVLTVKLGNLGTYVINKQTPNRQIWLSSPVSGPSRFDWDSMVKTWIYRRTKSKLLELLGEELSQLCEKPINFE